MIVPGSGHLRKLWWTLDKMNMLNRPDAIGIWGCEWCIRYTKRSVVYVGSNPSNASEVLTPFHKSTKSREVLDKWLDGSYCIGYENVRTMPTYGNKALTTAQIKEALPDFEKRIENWKAHKFKIVAVGKTAARALDMLGEDFFEMPHPSGLNRFWNDRAASDKKIKELQDWINAEDEI